MRETVRSGRRNNFYITENSFIDFYAREAGLGGIAVYHVLERFMNCETRSTWVGTAKIAELLKLSQRAVQRYLKRLEELKLIRIVRTSTMTLYFVVPVPTRPKTATIPLFDAVNDEEIAAMARDMSVASATTRSSHATVGSLQATMQSATATLLSPSGDYSVAAYKEEQDSLNQTKEQDLFNKTFPQEIDEVGGAAKRIIKILGLPDTMLNAAMSAVEARVKGTNLSLDGVVQEIVTAANHAQRRGVDKHDFLEDFLIQVSAQQMVENLGLPATNNLISTVKAAIKAEIRYTGFSVEKVGALVTSAAVEDRRRGITLDRFYFENVKWRSNVRVSKAEQRKLDNLEVNARIKQRLRERFGAS